jgi:orotidine-5'-phosphate decarboxylase
MRLAALAQKAGLDGVVCAPHEIATLRAACGPDFLLVVPGIRPAGAETGDQKRVMTPPEAAALGADILVIGRPITQAPDPAAAAAAIAASLGG